MSLAYPILAVDSINVSNKRVSAELRIGPRREQIVLGFSIPSLIEFKSMPNMLEDIHPALKAVLDVLSRAYHGEAVSLPLDLSDAVRADETHPWPLYLGREERAAVPPITVEMTYVERDTPELGFVTVHLTVAEVPTVVIVDLRSKHWKFRFVSGVHPWQLTSAEAWVMIDALTKATEL